MRCDQVANWVPAPWAEMPGVWQRAMHLEGRFGRRSPDEVAPPAECVPFHGAWLTGRLPLAACVWLGRC